jgi:hypothetical protein
LASASAAQALQEGRARLQADAEELLAFERQLPPKLVKGLRGLLNLDNVRSNLGLEVRQPPTPEEPLTGRGMAKGGKSRPTAVCRTCRQVYLIDENGPTACHTHPGYWQTAPNRGRGAAVANAARAIIFSKQAGNRYHVDTIDDDVGRWSCCKARDHDAKGCVVQHHLPVE